MYVGQIHRVLIVVTGYYADAFLPNPLHFEVHGSPLIKRCNSVGDDRMDSSGD
jgi:hypothetical protein